MDASRLLLVVLHSWIVPSLLPAIRVWPSGFRWPPGARPGCRRPTARRPLRAWSPRPCAGLCRRASCHGLCRPQRAVWRRRQPGRWHCRPVPSLSAGSNVLLPLSESSGSRAQLTSPSSAAAALTVSSSMSWAFHSASRASITAGSPAEPAALSRECCSSATTTSASAGSSIRCAEPPGRRPFQATTQPASLNAASSLSAVRPL